MASILSETVVGQHTFWLFIFEKPYQEFGLSYWLHHEKSRETALTAPTVKQNTVFTLHEKKKKISAETISACLLVSTNQITHET